MALTIICWNIQKLSGEKARTYKFEIAKTVYEHVQDQPFCFFILEAAHQDSDVLSPIVQALKFFGVKNISWNEMDVGGSAHRKENILVIYGNGAIGFSEVKTEWQATFNKLASEKLKDDQDQEELRYEQNKENKHLRDTPSRLGFHKAFMEHETLSAKSFRNPIVCTVSHQTDKVTVCAVHSPGPRNGDSKSRELVYAPYYNQSIVAWLENWSVNILLGDFNQCGEIETDLKYMTEGCGGTTKGKIKGLSGSNSHYDRVYANIPCKSTVAFDTLEHRSVSDHGLTITTITSSPTFPLFSTFPNIGKTNLNNNNSMDLS